MILGVSGFSLDSYAYAETMGYLYDITGHGWVCLRTNEQMDVDFETGAYPDGTQVLILEKRDDGLFDIPRHKVQIGRATGWVFEDEFLAENEWLQKKESGQYVLFMNRWHLERYAHQFAEFYESASIFVDDPIYGIALESPFTALGIYNGMIHVQLSKVDGFLHEFNCIPDIMKPDDWYFDREKKIWISAMERAITQTKGADESNWTRTERFLFYAIDPTKWSFARQIDPEECDICSAEAERIIRQALVSEGLVTHDTIAQFERQWHTLFYGYDDPTKHIWEFAFSDAIHSAEPESFTEIIVELDAHTGVIVFLLFDD